MAERFHSAEIVKTGEGKQYHIGVRPGEAAPYILLCGDPARATRVSKYFDAVEYERSNREYRTYTGTYKGIPVTVMATGIGCDNTEIAVVELSQCVEQPTFVRIGSCGALKKEIKLADLVISSGAVRLENTSLYFVNEGYPAVAHYEVVLALLQAARARGLPHHLGLTATAPGFYGAQARKVPGFPPRFPDLEKDLERMNVSNFEMETSLLFTLASLRGVRAGAVCAAYANRHANTFIDTDTKDRAELSCIECGLGALEILYQMDGEKRKAKAQHWTPELARPRK
ncbi:MAG: nucleoside phosphorylase [Planctomycetes bacterium]|nr:nucleoside phosphorylase [Planctomycetota bacterium]